MSVQYLRVLGVEALRQIHEASLQILDRTGMLIEHARAREILEAVGASVNHETHVVRFPPDLVEDRLSLVPRRIEYHGRTAEFDFGCEPDGDIYSQVGGGSMGYIDLATGQHRPARLDDLREFAILGDALPNMHVAAAHICADVPATTSDLHCLQVLLQSQRRPISTNAFTVDNLRYMIDMLLAVQGSRAELARRPLMHLELSPISPLSLGEDDASQLLLACEYGIPTLFPVMPSTGATGPITLAGTLAQANAEWLGMVTLTESARPGHPVPFFIDPVVADMRTVAAQFAAPEAGLLLAAISELGRELYGFPVQANGLCTDGFSYPQTLFQKAQNVLFQCLAGGKLLIGAGEIESVVSFDPVQLVIDDEIMAIARRWLRGVTVDDDTLAVDVIGQVGPRGHFLDRDHTVSHLRKGELMRTVLFEHGSRETWLASGAETLVAAARQKARGILASHEVPALPDGVTRELQSIIEAADEEQARAH